MELNEEYKQIFLEESNEQLDEWEEALLTLENDPSNQAMINQAFRAIHTIKGSAGFIGFEELQRIAHDLESILQDFRDSNKPIPNNIIGILFDGMDFCKRMIENLNNDVTEPLNIKPLLQKIESINLNKTDEDISDEDVSGRDEEKEKNSSVLEPLDEDKKAQKIESISLNKTGEGKSGEGVSGRYEKKEKNSSVLELLDESKDNQKNRVVLKLETEAEKREAYLRLILVKQKISEIGTILSLEPSPESIKNIKKGTSFTFKIETDSSLEELRKSADIDQINIVSVELEESLAGVSSEKLNEKLVVGELSKEPNLQRNQEKKHTEEKVSNTYEQTNRNVAKLIKTEDIVRVPAEKLDAMLNLVGELVVHNSAFSSITDELKEKYGRTNLILNLEGKTESLSKVAWELQDAVMKVRMLPVASVFKRFFRVVRDLAKMEKKDIELEIFGEETEIDKKIIDRIGEPLVHLVRNSVDHGIEPAEVRLSLGKNKTGHIKLGAFQEGDHICIELTDDGKGLDREAIANKAIEK
ncbi:MAG: Hpt domain-containing protein, partial [Spirochaetaceae bacterium]|nr:Hpt domain-containing protein [Spirochaetaceae bacterium]